jgi:hypothetical protein
MPALAAIPFPDANAVMMALLGSLQVNGTPVPIVLALPNDFTPPIIEIKRIGGRPDADGYTDFPIILVNYWGVDYDSAQALASAGHTKIEMSPLTEVTTLHRRESHDRHCRDLGRRTRTPRRLSQMSGISPRPTSWGFAASGGTSNT